MADDPYKVIVERHFRVYEQRSERLPGGTARLFFIMFQQAELERRFEAARKELLAADPDLIVFLRHEGGEDVLVIAPREPVLNKSTRLNWILLGLTLMTTIASGALYWQGYRHIGEPWSWAVLWSPEHLLWGFLLYALPLMVILGIHEAAHFMAARKHGLRATLPYFIPFPPILIPIGTLGAFIRLKDPLPDRKALFDVGASGPIAGFIVAIPVLLLGAMLTGSDAIEVPDRDRPVIELEAEHLLEEDATGQTTVRLQSAAQGTYLVRIHNTAGDDWVYGITATVHVAGRDAPVQENVAGSLDANASVLHTFTVPANATAAELVIDWEDGLIRFGDPLFVKGLEWVGLQDEGHLTHPMYFAGWLGLFVTGLNLIPASQLDGGHVARAILGDKMRYAAYVAVGVLFYLAFQFTTWLLLAFLILLMGVRHPPPLNDRVKLDAKRRVLAAFVVIVLIVTFIPQPFIF